MSRQTVFTLILCATLGQVTRSAAQTEPSVTLGAKVRVIVPSADYSRLAEGSLLRFAGDTVVIGTRGASDSTGIRTIVLDHTKRLEVYSPGPGHGGDGAALGGVVGATIGAVIAANGWKPCTQGGLACLAHPGQEVTAMGGALAGGLGGALLGYAFGSGIHGTWTPVHSTGVHIAVGPGGVGVRLTF